MISIPPLLAQASLRGLIDQFVANIVQPVTLLIAIVMIIWSAILFQDGKSREGIFALIGAFLLGLAPTIVRLIFASTGTTP
jgi:hypothetical protein